MLIMLHIIIYSDFIAYIVRNNGTNNDICYTLQKQHQLSYERVRYGGLQKGYHFMNTIMRTKEL